jgi:chromosome segregation ATPase
VQLTKMNSQLEREARAARTDCRNLERVVKEGREKLEAVEAGRRGEREKMGRVRGRVKELLGRFGKLAGVFRGDQVQSIIIPHNVQTRNLVAHQTVRQAAHVKPPPILQRPLME